MIEIQIEDVSKTYTAKTGTVEALKHVSLSIESGDIYGIIGMSGAGKSTLVRCMNFLETPTSGRVKIRGTALDTLSGRELRIQRQKIGMIFQQFNLLMQKNVLENICFPLYIQGKKKAEAKKRAQELLELVGMKEKARAYPAQLSGGQKQRVAIARALASDPEILLCDEATSALDPQTTASILELLKEINEKFGITIVLITHQMAVVREICSHVAIMKAGEVVETGAVEEVFAHPQAETTKELLRRDNGSESDEKLLNVEKSIQHGEVIRIIFSANSAFEPVISNLVLTFQEPVNILKAATKNVGGIAKGEMLLAFKENSQQKEAMKAYIRACGVEIEEAITDVDT